jgi:hypothetical protein
VAIGTILVTGAGTGFGIEIAFRLAAQGHDVIAGVEIVAQVWALEQEAKRRGVKLRIEKLDVTSEEDREKAWQWDVDVLFNNAGISEGGSMVDIPAANLRRQFEVNVFGPMLLTQGFARKMVARKSGKIIFMSSQAGLTSDPFTGAYSGSKHAVEAFAEALGKELREFGVQVATVNPGPFLTGFNDRMFEAWRSWKDDPSRRIFDYENISYLYEQYDPEPVVETSVGLVTGAVTTYRNLVPQEMAPQMRRQLAAVWGQRVTDGLGHRHEAVQKAYDMQPETPVAAR